MMRLIINQPDILYFSVHPKEGNTVIIDDPAAIVWYWATRNPPACCGHPMIPHGPAVPDRWRCCHCHTDHDISPT